MTEDNFRTEYHELLETFPHGNKIVDFHKKWHDHMGPQSVEILLLCGLLSELTQAKAVSAHTNIPPSVLKDIL